MVAKPKSTLYHWTSALDFSMLSFHDFVDLFSLFN
jgi:hypothetical protein